jgi:hypothetical protein
LVDLFEFEFFVVGLTVIIKVSPLRVLGVNAPAGSEGCVLVM